MKIFLFIIYFFTHPIFASQLDRETNKELFRKFYSYQGTLETFNSSAQQQHIEAIKTLSLNINTNLKPEPWLGELPPIWELHQDKGEDLSKRVFFEHGGGLIHILQFLRGQSKGYRLCGIPEGRMGIQVSPFVDELNESARADIYAKERMLLKYFDYPAVLIGSIERKYLDAQENAYEAGIRNEHFDKIKILLLQPLALTMKELGPDNYYTIPILEDFFQDLRAETISLPTGLLELYDNNINKLADSWNIVSDPYHINREFYPAIKSKIRGLMNI